MKNHAGFIKTLGLKYFILLFIVSVVYIVSGKLGLQLAFLNASATAVWPPTGIALAAILLFGYRIFPAIFIGAFITNITTAGSVGSSIGIATGNTLEALVGAYLVTRFANGKNAFEKVTDIFKFTILAGLISTAVSASIGVFSISLGGFANWKDFWPIWITWWLGDAGGNIIVAPLILLWRSHIGIKWNPNETIEILTYYIFVIFIGEFIFTGAFPYPYLCIPVLIWGAFRFGQKETATAMVILSTIAIWDTLHGIGPYAMPGNLNESLLLVQMFLAVSAVTTMTLTAALLERRKTRRELQTSERRFKVLIEKSFDAVVLIDPTSKILYASPTVEKLLGYSPDEMKGMTGFDLVAPDDRKKTMKTLTELVLKPGSSVDIEYKTIRKDGKIIWVEATGTNLLFEPNINAVVVNFRDITERKIIEDTIAGEKAEDEAIIASIGEGLLVTDEKGIITVANRAAVKMLKSKTDELIGHNLIDVVPMEEGSGERLNPEDRPITKVLSFGNMGFTSFSKYYVRADKTRFPVEFTLTPFVVDKKIIGTVEIFRDISEEKEIDRAKTEFVSLASHQLRTPLTTINWYTERLIGKKLGEMTLEQKKYLEEIYKAGRRMSKLINALLNVSRLELGTYSIEPEKTSIPDLTKQMLNELIFQIKEKNLSLTEKFAKNFPEIDVDPKLIGIMLQNLLSNAVKYTPKGGKIGVDISYDKKDVKIIVSDNGYGIPQKQQKKLFTKLFRADNIRDVDTDGTGLGLYLVKLLLDKIGGKISFVSQESKGSTFTVLIPLAGMQSKKGTRHIE